jgi:hypothetical protein
MKITVESTTKVVELETLKGTVPARIWEGTTDSGIPVHVFITRIGVHESQDQTQFEKELKTCRTPSAEVCAFPLRMIL